MRVCTVIVGLALVACSSDVPMPAAPAAHSVPTSGRPEPVARVSSDDVRVRLRGLSLNASRTGVLVGWCIANESSAPLVAFTGGIEPTAMHIEHDFAWVRFGREQDRWIVVISKRDRKLATIDGVSTLPIDYPAHTRGELLPSGAQVCGETEVAGSGNALLVFERDAYQATAAAQGAPNSLSLLSDWCAVEIGVAAMPPEDSYESPAGVIVSGNSVGALQTLIRSQAAPCVGPAVSTPADGDR